MNKTATSLETVIDLFIYIALDIVRLQHPSVTDEAELLPHLSNLLRQAVNTYDRALYEGGTQSEAIYDVYLFFETMNLVLTHRRKWRW